MSKDKQVTPVEAPTRQQSIGQTILIVLLILAVGLIFGVGQSSITMAMDTKAVVEVQQGLTNIDYKRYARVITIINLLYRGEKPQDLDDQVWSSSLDNTFRQVMSTTNNSLLIGKLGEKEGMKPSGDKLKKIVDEFLANELHGGDYPTLGAGLQAVMRADVTGRSITTLEIQEFIANETADENYRRRYMPNIVVNKNAADVLKSLANEKIHTEEVTISVAAIIEDFKAEVAADQVALDAKYEYIKKERFVIPRRCQLSAIGVDVNVIRQSVQVSDEEIGAYFAANIATDPLLKKPAPPVVPKEGEAPVAPTLIEKTLDESRAYIRGKIEEEKAEIIAAELCDLFDNGLNAEGLIEEAHVAAGKMEDVFALAKSITISASDERLNKDVSLVLWQKLAADQPRDGKTYSIQLEDGKHFAKMEIQNPSLFDKEVNSMFLRAQASDNKSLYLYQIVNGFTPESHKDYESVKDEVILLVSAEKAYAKLLENAQALLAAAAQQAEPSLTKFFEAAEQKKWAAQITTKTYGPLDSVVPPEGVNALISPIIAYTQGGKEFFLRTADKDGDMQRITLSRVVGFGAEADESTNVDRYATELKRAVARLSGADFGAVLDAALKKE